MILESNGLFKCYDNLNDGVFVVSNNRFIYANRRFANLFQLTISEILNANPFDIIIENENAQKIFCLQNTDVNIELLDLECIKKDNIPFAIEVSCSTFDLNYPNSIVCIARDITESKNRKKARLSC